MISISSASTDDAVINVLSNKWADGIASAYFSSGAADFMELKAKAGRPRPADEHIDQQLYMDDMRPNSDGLVPVVVQDYKTSEVLMVPI